MSAKIDVIGNLREALYAAKAEGNATVAMNSVFRYSEMLIRKMEATEEALKGRLASERLDMFQRVVVSLSPTCVDNSQYRDQRISVGRMVELAQHIAYEASRHTEPEVRNRIEAKFNI